MAQRQILCPCGRADGIGLNEAEPLDRSAEGRGSEEAPPDGEGGEIAKVEVAQLGPDAVETAPRVGSESAANEASRQPLPF
jgi:hypothetical protein